MQRALILCADHSRWLLILGLAAGIGLPGVAAFLAGHLPEMVSLLLAITAFRIGEKDAFGAFRDLRWSIPAVLVLQMVVPLVIATGFWLTGQLATPLALALVLATSAPTLTGGASLAIILRQDPARMMQLLILGTALFPLTTFIVLGLFPIAGETGQILEAGARAFATILAAAILGFRFRRWLLPHPNAQQLRAMDGAAILAFAVIVVGLMAALNPVLSTDPWAALEWIGIAFALSFAAQLVTLLILGRTPLAHVAGPLALAAGNRNIALFLVALPAEVVAPVMIFVACWQLPMYLTPVLLPKFYALVPVHD